MAQVIPYTRAHWAKDLLAAGISRGVACIYGRRLADKYRKRLQIEHAKRLITFARAGRLNRLADLLALRERDA